MKSLSTLLLAIALFSANIALNGAQYAGPDYIEEIPRPAKLTNQDYSEGKTANPNITNNAISNNDTSSTSTERALSDGGIAGVVVAGCVVLAVAIFLLVWFLHPSCEHARNEPPAERDARIREECRQCCHGCRYQKCEDCGTCGPDYDGCKSTCCDCSCETGPTGLCQSCSYTCGADKCGNYRWTPTSCYSDSCHKCTICDCGTCGNYKVATCTGPRDRCGPGCVTKCKDCRLECNRIAPETRPSDTNVTISTTPTAIHITRDARDVIREQPGSKNIQQIEPTGHAHGRLPPIEHR